MAVLSSSSSSCQAALAVALLSFHIIPFSAVLGVLFLPGLSGQVKTGSIWLEVTPQLLHPTPLGEQQLRQGSGAEFCLLLSVGLHCHCKARAGNKWVKRKMFIFRTGTMINMWNLAGVCLLYLFEMQSACLLKYLCKGQHNLCNECAGLLESR